MTKQHSAAFAKLTPGTVAHAQHKKGIGSEPLQLILDSLVTYAERHERRFESKLAEDYILGPAWLKAAIGAREMLNGEGNFDGGTLEGVFWAAMDAAGYKEEDI